MTDKNNKPEINIDYNENAKWKKALDGIANIKGLDGMTAIMENIERHSPGNIVSHLLQTFQESIERIFEPELSVLIEKYPDDNKETLMDLCTGFLQKKYPAQEDNNIQDDTENSQSFTAQYKQELLEYAANNIQAARNESEYKAKINDLYTDQDTQYTRDSMLQYRRFFIPLTQSKQYKNVDHEELVLVITSFIHEKKNQIEDIYFPTTDDIQLLLAFATEYFQELEAKKAAEVLPKVFAPQVKNLLFDNSKTTGLFFEAIEGKRIIEGCDNQVDLTPNSKTESIVTIYMEKMETIATFSQQLNKFDYAVLDAVNTLYSIESYFNTENIYRILARDNNAQLKPGSKMERNIKESLKRLEATKVSIDASGIRNIYNINKETIEVLKVESRMLQFEKATVLVNGQRTVDWYHLLQEPKLLTLAKQLKQVRRIPLEGLKTNISVTEDTVELQQYLIRRCVGAGGGMKSRILLTTILKQLGISKDERMKIKRTIEKIVNILDSWSKAGDIISGYTIETGKTANSVIAFNIQPPKKKQ